MTPKLDLDTLVLQRGSHRNRSEGMCIMEAVAYLGGEAHSDAPQCACPVIAAIGRRLNDRMADGPRQSLRPIAPLIVGTRSTPEVERRRAWMAADWATRVAAPMYLDLAGEGSALAQRAKVLRALDEMLGPDAGRTRLLREISDEAWAFRSEAFDRLRSNVRERLKEHPAADAAAAAAAAADADAAAVAAADAVAVAVAAAAAVAVAVAVAVAAAAAKSRLAFGSHGYQKAYRVAYDAAKGAIDTVVRSRLQPTRELVEASAVDLLRRLCAVTPETIAAERDGGAV